MHAHRTEPCARTLNSFSAHARTHTSADWRVERACQRVMLDVGEEEKRRCLHLGDAVAP